MYQYRIRKTSWMELYVILLNCFGHCIMSKRAYFFGYHCYCYYCFCLVSNTRA